MVIMRRRFTTLKEKDESEYLIFTALEHGFSFVPPRDVEYRIGINGKWKFLSGGTRSDYVDDGSEIFVRSEFISADIIKPPFGTFILDGMCNLSGSPMALLNKRYSIENSNVFKEMFKNCKGVREVSANFLPSTILSTSCYESMFYGCTSLTIAPELPATTLKVACYHEMFYGCSNLSYIKALFLTIPYFPDSDLQPTFDWLEGVASTGTFVKNKDATWDVVGIDGVPSGWTIRYE